MMKAAARAPIGSSADVVLGLMAGVQHQHVPAALRAAPAAGRSLVAEEVAGPVKLLVAAFLLARLLGFENETAALVEIDAAARRAAVRCGSLTTRSNT